MQKHILKNNFIFIIILVSFLAYPLFAFASNYKSFKIEKVGEDRLLISRRSFQYIIEYNHQCHEGDFSEGQTIHIEAYYSPRYGDQIVAPGLYSDATCEITQSNEVDMEEYYVEKTIASKDQIIVSDKYGNKYLIEYGLGCGLSMWKYENEYIDIDIGGGFLNGISDRIYLLDSGRDCKVWDVQDLFATKVAEPPIITCPKHAILREGKCICDKGYRPYQGECITYDQKCKKVFGRHSYATDEEMCSCEKGYKWNPERNECIEIICPSNSTKVGSSCVCRSGFKWNEKETNCIKTVTKITNKNKDKSSVYNLDPKTNKKSRPTTEKEDKSPEIEKMNSNQITHEGKEIHKETQTSQTKQTKQEEKKSASAILSRIFNAVKNFFACLF